MLVLLITSYTYVAYLTELSPPLSIKKGFRRDMIKKLFNGACHDILRKL